MVNYEKIYISASEMYNFIGKIPNKTAETACYKKIAKIFGGHVGGDGIITEAIQWGIDNEKLAKKWIERTTGIVFSTCDSTLHATLPISATPDGYNKQKNITLEIKCPNSDTHIKYISSIFDNDTLKKTAPEYYWQVQTQMLVFGAEKAFFCTFDPRLDKSTIGLKIVNILPEEEAFAEIEEKATFWVNFIKKTIQNILR